MGPVGDFLEILEQWCLYLNQVGMKKFPGECSNTRVTFHFTGWLIGPM